METNQRDIVDWEERMSRKEAAEYLGVKPATVANYDIPFVRMGKVYYFKRDIDAFIAQQRAKSMQRKKEKRDP